ncbi:carbonic anhydrase [Tautonia plasticadhaerens]|uniref:Carbonic anhydrase n=1 Tax=Tautonia plasticadhaerens TaxID=2527974 RepID=A0A518GVM8_9BACT|nr:carbonic anhydrase [Tautonia plasticadhaerens]QDV32601.1 Carbonic anhydrase [Tautonia plasticadhaerens]
MQPPHCPSRREFVRVAGLATGAAGLVISGSARSAVPATRAPDPDVVLAELLEGNGRFMNGQTSLLTRRRPEDFASLAEGQAPTAIIVACSDSRVAPELVFDQGVGDLFVVRVAGNHVTGAGPIVQGSIEFAVAVLGARLILVLGHDKCGAVEGAIARSESDEPLPGSIDALVKIIKPAVADAEGKPGDRLDNVIRANVERCVGSLKTAGPILPDLVGSGELKVVGGVYRLRSGKVELFD